MLPSLKNVCGGLHSRVRAITPAVENALCSPLLRPIPLLSLTILAKQAGKGHYLSPVAGSSTALAPGSGPVSFSPGVTGSTPIHSVSAVVCRQETKRCPTEHRKPRSARSRRPTGNGRWMRPRKKLRRSGAFVFVDVWLLAAVGRQVFRKDGTGADPGHHAVRVGSSGQDHGTARNLGLFGRCRRRQNTHVGGGRRVDHSRYVG
jgi:hypothetical protein